MVAIKAWWFLSGACFESAMKDLTSWLDFWHFHYKQWGSHIFEVLVTFLVLVVVEIPDCGTILGLSMEGCAS